MSFKGILPGLGPEEQIFAIGDIHGQAETLDKALKRIRNTPRNSTPSHLIFTGDVIDRGPQNLRSIDLVMGAADYANVDKVTLLPGNHELMMRKAIMTGADQRDRMEFWARFGGFQVIEEVDPTLKTRSIKDIGVAVADRLSGFIDLIDAAPNALRAGDLIFVHAGIMPGHDIDAFLSQDRFKEDNPSEHWAWIRSKFINHHGGWDEDRKVVVVHGHTPQNLDQKIDPAYTGEFLDRTNHSRRICLDAGASRMGQLGLLNIRGDQYSLEVIQECPFNPNLETCDPPISCENAGQPELE